MILDKFKELPEQLGGMRDNGESSESEKSWGSEDEPANEHPSRVAARGRHVPPVQQIQPESEPSMDCSEPTTTDPLEEEEEDPWSGMQDPWANGRDPWSGGGSQGGSANSTAPDPRDGQDRLAKPNPGAPVGDPWDHGNDPWSKGRTNGKGTAPATVQEGFGKGGKGKEDPWLRSDPWGAGKGKPVPRPKPPPPKPPSSDGEEPQNTRSRAARGVGTAGQSRQRGVDGEKKVDYLDYAKRQAGSKTFLLVFSKRLCHMVVRRK